MATFFLLLSILLTASVAGFVVWQDWRMFRVKRVRTTGTVIDHSTSEDDGSTYYMARIRFADEYGRNHEFVDSYGKFKPTPAVGIEMPVVYPAGAAQDAIVPRPVLRVAIYAFLFGMLGVLLAKLFGFVTG
ncbi:MAG: DUF3592 domain-containing protein [Rhizobiaceae bacterium]